jgi:hypothetical protein
MRLQTDAYWTTRKVLQTIGERLDEERLARVEEAVLGVGDAYGRWPRARSLRPNRLSGLGPHEIGVRLVTGINRESVNIATRRYWGIGQETDPGRGRARRHAAPLRRLPPERGSVMNRQR